MFYQRKFTLGGFWTVYEVWSELNAGALIWFGIFFGIVIAEAEVLSAAVYPPPERLGKLVFDDGLKDLILARLEALLEQQKANELWLHSSKEKKVC